MGNSRYIGSWLTMVASVPVVGPTTLPSVTAVRPIRPSIGAWMSVYARLICEVRSCACAPSNWAAWLRCVAVASSTVERWPAGVFSSELARPSVMVAFCSTAFACATTAVLACTSASNGGFSME